jgi:hypothetical protein
MNTALQRGYDINLKNYSSDHYKKIFGNRYDEFVKELKDNYNAVLKAYGDRV